MRIEIQIGSEKAAAFISGISCHYGIDPISAVDP